MFRSQILEVFELVRGGGLFIIETNVTVEYINCFYHFLFITAQSNTCKNFIWVYLKFA